MLLKGQEQRTTTTSEFQQKRVQLLQTKAFPKTVAGFGRSFHGIDGLNTVFGVLQHRMVSVSDKEGAC